MSWHIPPSGTKLFCVLSVELLGVENPVFSSPFHQGSGGAAKLPALPALSPFHPAKTGRLEFLRTVVPTTGEGPVGSLDHAHWAKGCSSTQALPKSRPIRGGAGPWRTRCRPLAIPEHPLRAGCLLQLNIGASGSCQSRTGLPHVFSFVVYGNKCPNCWLRKSGSWGLALQRRFLKALCLDLAGAP